MNKKKWLIIGGVVIVLAVLAGVGYMYIVRNKADAPKAPVLTGNMQAIDDLKVTYELDADTQKLYDITVMSGTAAAKQNGTTTYSSSDAISITGKACNNTSGAIPMVAADKVVKDDKGIVKTLNDGRKVLVPQTRSTLMACTDKTPATDDAALNKVFEAIAASLQSY